MMISQKLIAEKAGVAEATVSRALTHSAKVSPATLSRIRRAMNELGVNADDVFLGKSALSKTVTLIVGDICKEFYAHVLSGLCEVLNAEGFSTVLCNSQYDEQREMDAIRRAEESGHAGVVMLSVRESEGLVHLLENARVPVLLVNRHIRSLDLDVVKIDNYRGGYLAAQHLLEMGHRRIAHLAGPTTSTAAADRLRGFRDALEDRNVPFGENDVMIGDLSRECGKSFAAWLKGMDYTAAFIGSDYMTAGALYQLQKDELCVPDDISIVGYDDTSPIRENTIGITTLSFDPEAMGKSAARALLRRLDDPLGASVKTVFSPSLIQRNSVKRI